MGRRGISQDGMKLEPFLQQVSKRVTGDGQIGLGPERPVFDEDGLGQCWYLGAGYWRANYSPVARRLWLVNPDYTPDECGVVEHAVSLLLNRHLTRKDRQRERKP